MVQAEKATVGTTALRGLMGRCPHCGKGRLFQGFLHVRPSCEACGLNFTFAAAGDGTAVFIMMIAGFIVTGAALWVEVVFDPPFWVHALLWGPLAIVVCVAPLRPLKGMLIALQHRFQAGPGRLDTGSGA